ncbi:MAG: DNA repair protein RecO [Acholeplasmataceae bacterium]|nr:DNA repair protein RecO [Acholeplasmataceae bacterium]
MISRGLIYKTQDYQESSKLLYVYTPYGKYTLVSKGSKNYKNPNHYLSDYLTLISFELNPDKPMQTLKQATLIDDYQSLKKDYLKVQNASVILNSIQFLLTDDLPHERLFNLIIQLLSFNDLNFAALTYIIKLTYGLGYELSFKKENAVGFNLATGQTVSKNEALKPDLNVNETIHLMKLYYLTEEIEIEQEIKNILIKFIKAYYEYHMDYEIKGL